MIEKIIEIAKKLCDKELEWNENISIINDMELSSLDFFEFICNVEDAFDIRLSERQIRKIDTLGDLAILVQNEK